MLQSSFGASTLCAAACRSFLQFPPLCASCCNALPRDTSAFWTLAPSRQTASRAPSREETPDLGGKKSIHLYKHQVGNKTLRGKLPVNQDLKDEVWLTFDESLTHQVIIHRLCNDLRHFIAVKLDESVTFAVTSLQTNRERNKVTVTDSQMFSFPPDVCWHMGFITLITGRAGDKLNVPEYSRLSYLTSDHFYIWDHFQSQPKLQILRSGASNRLLPGLLKPK